MQATQPPVRAERGVTVLMIGRRLIFGRWGLLLFLARTIWRQGSERWRRLTPGERSELRRLVTTSRGRRSNLSAADQAELRRIVRKANGREPEPLASQ